jgi:hypothetical protein
MQEVGVQLQVQVIGPIVDMFRSISRALGKLWRMLRGDLRRRESPQTKHFLTITKKKQSFTPAINRRKISSRRTVVYDRKLKVQGL